MIAKTACVLALGLACLQAPLGGHQESPAPAHVERQLGAMGTWLTISVEGPTRARALEASEAALLAIERCEARLSTWREDSELARFNRSAPGQPFTLSAELARELATAREVFVRTEGAFDPGLGGLVQAWGLRSGGRRPGAGELEQARVPGGFAAAHLEGTSARRGHAALILEEGGFGKGAGLDAALRALRELGVSRASVDLGGQVAVLTDGLEPLRWDVADPRQRELAVVGLELLEGSLATSGNSERGIVVDGVRLGHLLDPRTASPAPDFGSLTVWAADATRADAFATGLYVLGPEAALAFGCANPDVDVLVLEPLADGTLRARATGRLAASARILDARVRSVEVAALPESARGPEDSR